MILSLEDYWFIILAISTLSVIGIIFVAVVFNIDTILSWIVEQRKRYNSIKVHWAIKLVILSLAIACAVLLCRALDSYIVY